ncbi:DUF6585 family protein [Sorangium sp. So ce1097]|uniref:DUF6585 family protein n=1 Tax=Sorangium sp. So ce1097 TaxID=3133330 RepID=UPI003F6040C4
MQPHPFRQPAERPTAPPEEQRLGALRSVHGQRRNAALFHVARGALLLLSTSVIGAVIAGLQGFLLSLPFGLAGFAVLAAAALRHRGLRIELYEHGLVVARGEGREIAVFDDVDEVWFDLDRSSTPFGSFVFLRGFRLVEHSGEQRSVPVEVADGQEVARRILQRCSHPLLDEARRAVKDGEALTFGPVRLDRQGIALRDTHVAWGDLSLVRLQSGRIAFFRGQTVFPWRTVSLDTVPHPTVFARLVTERAPRVERDDVWAAWTG